MRIVTATLLAGVLSGCESRATADAQAVNGDSALARAFTAEISRIRAAGDSLDAIFQPLPLLRPAEAGALRRFDNAAQLAVAARNGISPETNTSDLTELVRARRLVRIADSTTLWVVRKLDHSSPYLTPAAHALVTTIAERFQSELARIGAPRFRLEITSMLRSAEDHEALRRVNPNAASGRSTHQYGTTFDIAYNAFAAPADAITPTTIPAVAALMAEAIAARRSRELMAILGQVLLERQAAGAAMITLEQLQPVYHITATGR